jgi:hypothetical protein
MPVSRSFQANVPFPMGQLHPQLSTHVLPRLGSGVGSGAAVRNFKSLIERAQSRRQRFAYSETASRFEIKYTTSRRRLSKLLQLPGERAVENAVDLDRAAKARARR